MEKQSKDGLASEKPNKEIVELIQYNKRGETVLQYGSLVTETVIRSHEIQKGRLHG